VKFEQTVTAVVKEMPDAIFIEMGPHPALSSYISGMGAKADKVLCPMRRTKKVTEFSEISELLIALGKLSTLGVNTIDFNAINGTHTLEISRPLPAYPLAPKHMPLYSENSQLVVKQKRNRKGPLNHDFFGLNAQTHPDLAQHIINGEPIIPATGFVEMVRVSSDSRHRVFSSIPSRSSRRVRARYGILNSSGCCRSSPRKC
jgi:acyl transferase domain-containing protein